MNNASDVIITAAGCSGLQKIQNMDLDSWVNVRGPRPWEPSENTDVNEQKRT